MNGLLPAESQSQMASDIQPMLLQFHNDIVNDSWSDAWSLLSARKQKQYLTEYGYQTWISDQQSLGQYLDPSGLQVSVQAANPATGVAQVMVTGMTYTPSGGSPCAWDGITWVKYENGSWHYDPGYSTTPQREAVWKPRFSELLGGQCSTG
jgi:hypothetical protein